MDGDAIYSPFLATFIILSKLEMFIQIAQIKKNLERWVIKIRKIISVFRRHKMNIFLEMEQKSTITHVEEDLIKTKKSDGKWNDFY